MLKSLFRIYLVTLGEVLDDVDIESVFHDESSCPRSLSIASSFIYRLHYCKIVSASAVVVVFTECRSGMYYAGTVFCRYIVHACHDESRLALLRHDERLDLFVSPVLHFGALDLLNYLKFIIRKHLVSKSFGEPEVIALVFS